MLKKMSCVKKLTSTNGENVDTDEEWNLGRAMLKELSGTTSNDQNVTNTAEHDTPEDHGVATESSIGEISDEERQAVGQEVEGLVSGIGNLGAEAQGTLRGLAAGRHGTETIATEGERTVNVVGPDGGASVVGSSLAELDGAEQVGDSGQRAGHAAKGQHLLIGGLALVVSVENGGSMVTGSVVNVELTLLINVTVSIMGITMDGDLLVRVR